MNVLHKIKVNLNHIEKTENGFKGTLVHEEDTQHKDSREFEIDVRICKSSWSLRYDVKIDGMSYCYNCEVEAEERSWLDLLNDQVFMREDFIHTSKRENICNFMSSL